MYMMEGLDASFDACIFLGYHSSIGARYGIMSHTYNPRAIWEVRIDGHVVGESAINGLVAAQYKVPLALISGDETTMQEITPFVPEIERVIVKKSYSRYAAASIHPDVARKTLLMHTRTALQKQHLSKCMPRYAIPTTLEVTFLTADMAEACAVIKGVEVDAQRTRTVRCAGTDTLAIFRSFIGMIAITRPLVE